MKTTIACLLLAFTAPLMAGALPQLNFKKPRTVVFYNYFQQYDVDQDGMLSEAEFQGTVGSSNVPVINRHRFLTMASGSWEIVATAEVPVGIYVEEYIRYAGGLRVKNPSKAVRFDLADENGDSFLDPEEYPLTRMTLAIRRGWLVQSFNKLDKDDDGLISRAEYGLISEL